MREAPESSPTLLIAPCEGAKKLLDSLAELEPGVSLVVADPVAEGDDPGSVAAALAAYEGQADRLAPSAAIVHGSSDRAIAAVISLVKLGIPVARLSGPGAEPVGNDLAGLLADHTIPPGAPLPEQVRSWLRRILSA